LILTLFDPQKNIQPQAGHRGFPPQEQEQYLSVLVEIQQLLLETSDGSNAEFYCRILSPLAEAVRASRAYIFALDQDPLGYSLLRLKAEWCGDNILPRINLPKVDPNDSQSLPCGWLEILDQGQAIAGNVADFSAPEQAFLVSQGIHAILMLPIVVDAKFFGLLGFDFCQHAHSWHPPEIAFLQSAIAALGLGLAQRQAKAALLQTNHQLLDALERITNGFFALSHSGELTYVNQWAEPLLHRIREDILGQNFWQMFPELNHSPFFDYCQEAITHRRAVNFEEFFPSLNCWLAVHVYPSGSGLSVYLHDISDRKSTEKELLETKERYALAIMGSNDGIWDWDLLANQIYFSPHWKAILGYGESELENHPQEWFDRIHPQDLEQVNLSLTLHKQGQTPHFEQEYRIQSKNGTYLWVLSRGIAVRNGEGIPYRIAGSLTDITDRRLAQQQLQHDALHDPLTGLPNRTLFMDRLGQMIRQVRRRLDYRFAVLFIDLDRFKLINDSLGHLSGDQLLIQLSQRLTTSLRPGDTVARLGGDEFVILIDDLPEGLDANLFAQRIKSLLQNPFVLNGQAVSISASIGITLSNPQNTDPQDYLRNADIAMYQSKHDGGDRHTLFTGAQFTEGQFTDAKFDPEPTPE
jgi:diguanylate cyclase (GGDEF)-like protein/PAS domain S-box-containing protein